MNHTHIVHAADLDRYSPTRESQAVVPELVYWLVKQSVPPSSVCRIPYGDVVNQPGWDGLVKIDQAFLEYVPGGASYWEIGTGANPKTKATTDFKKRTEALSDEERAKSSFVFVTSRSSASGGWNEPDQTEWLEERKDSGWNAIKIIDGVKLADWLREFPALGRWMAKKAGITASLGGIITPGEHWDLSIAIDKLLTYGREGAAVMCIAYSSDDKAALDESLATRALIAVLESEGGIAELDNYQTVELIKRLQKSKTADQDALFRIEWNFLPWLDRFSSGSPVTLEKRLAKDPAFFAEAVGLVFRSKHDEKEKSAEPDEQKQNLARNAYKLLTEWRRCPGLSDDGALDVGAFNDWINEARRITERTGHAEVAQIQIGRVLSYAPPDPNGLWVHESIATVLNDRGAADMRSGFTMELFTQRGVYSFTHGREEREIAARNRQKADALDSKGFTRFGTQMRRLAEQYIRDAEREERRDPFET